MIRKAKIDSNQTAIVEELRVRGFHVLHIHQLKNCADLIIGKSGRLAYVEVKSDQDLPQKFFKMNEAEREEYLLGKLTDGEGKFLKGISYYGLPYIIGISGQEITI
jgi:hypothetical protein